jgi:DNA-binding NtrC family response regulator
MKHKILVIEDDEGFVNALRLTLRAHPVEIIWSATGADGISAYRKSLHGFATVIIDYCLPDHKGSEVAKTIRKLDPVQDILFASGHRDPDFLIDLLETGSARTFLPKGCPMDEIRARILDSISIYENRNRVLGLDSNNPSKAEVELKTAGFVGRSPGLYGVLGKIERYRASPYPTLIVGETGTGKELVAKALVPAGKTLIPINCARYVQSENLLESELFGYVKGSFTGANSDKAGILARAHGQVLFLDELHELSLASQAKLLRFLEEMKFRRVGDDSGREISVDVKIIAATKPEIEERVRNKLFLEDLFHRVAQLEIRVPPLRERTEDIEPLVRSIQDEFNAGKPAAEQKQVRISTVTEMMKQEWRGNVRELKAAVRRMLTDCTGDVVNPADFAAIVRKKGEFLAGPSLEATTAQVESETIRKALQNSDTNGEAASRLGLTRWTLNRKLARLGIDPRPLLSAKSKKENVC